MGELAGGGMTGRNAADGSIGLGTVGAEVIACDA